MLKSLAEACVPRDWVFDPSVRDTVHDIDELDQLDPARFFAENYVTQGMRTLLTEAFQRLEGRSQSASGIFLLSQTMGGGKTHNLLALGLLAKYPQWRQPVMGQFYTPGPLGAVRVLTFSGRKTHTPFGIWGELASQLNRREVLSDFYSPLAAPGVEDWVRLLRGDPTLILLDELPPYFQAARAIQIGQTTLDHLTTVALANLLVAVASGKLPNVCVVLTDLRAAAYEAGSTALNEALRNLEQEANRTATRVDPVRLNTHELYAILRQRLFAKVPSEHEIEAVGDAYARALEDAQKALDLAGLSAQALRQEILSSYPFHPAIRDLFARFRENPSFQQTRAIIRIMRIVVAQLWSSGIAKRKMLIGAHDIDLGRPDIISEIRQINATLDNAIAHDIVDEQGGAVAQRIDAELGGTHTRDAATLIFLSSLSQAVNPLLGLNRSEIIGYLAEPGRDVVSILSALEQLQRRAWYLHVTSAGQLLFKNVENLNAKLESYAQGLRDERELELRERLEKMFEPKVGACYQAVEPLPALDQVQLSSDRVTLIIFRPLPTALGEVERWWENQQYKNRVLFLTGTPTGYERVIERAAYLRAIQRILQEFRQQGLPETDPQLLEARKIADQQESQFYLACRETFQVLYYPYHTGLVRVDLDPRYFANRYEGEQQVVEALRRVGKFLDETSPDSSFRQSVETRLWPETQKEVLWTEVKRRAATDPRWFLHHPRALDQLKEALIQRDIWRDVGNGYVQRGPFPKPRTEVQVQLLARDENTGEATLRVKPLHGDVIYYSFHGPPSDRSERLHSGQLKTCELRVWFLAVDSRGEHETGDPFCWTNTLTVKYRFFQKDNRRMCELRAIPQGEIVYTVDGSNPEINGTAYHGPFEVPVGTRVILAQAKADGLVSPLLSVQVPQNGGPDPLIDRNHEAI